jgi:hypothetical protein
MHGWKLKATKLPFAFIANAREPLPLFDCYQFSFPLLAGINALYTKTASRRQKTIFNPIFV